MDNKSKGTNLWQLLKKNASLEVFVVIAIYIADRWSYNMYNAIQTTNAINNLAIGAAVIGVIGSLYSFSGLFFRLPSSNLMYRISLRKLMVGCFVVKIAVYVLTAFLPAENVFLYGLLRCVYALCWSFLGVSLPAMLAIAVDNRLVGTAYALYSGLTGTLTAPSRPWAISLMDSMGSNAFLVIAATALVPLVLSMLIRDNKFREKMEERQRASQMEAGQSGKRKFNFQWAFVPVCVFASIPLLSWSMYNEYLPLLGENIGFTYLTALGIASAIEGWMNLVGGVLCDIINPGIVAIGQCVLWGGALFLMGSASASTNMYPVFVMYGLGIGALGCIRIACMKAVSPKEQINLSGTYSLCNDVISACGATINGLLVTGLGYTGAFKTVAIMPILTALFCVYYFFLRKKKDTPAEAAAE